MDESDGVSTLSRTGLASFGSNYRDQVATSKAWPNSGTATAIADSRYTSTDFSATMHGTQRTIKAQT